GKALARSALVASLYARPKEIKNPAATAKTLAQITGEPSKELLSKLKSSKPFVFLKREIDPKQQKKIEALRLPGIGFENEFRRFYPYRDMAAHLLGFVKVDEVGMSGLELTYNKVISGEPGRVSWLVDAHGKSYQREQQLPLPGATITTTIDSPIQHIVQKELRAAAEKTQAAGISIVVMDPNSGAILAMANSPSFNPNAYGRFPESSYSLNPSVALTYEPGSTFKMVTIAAALEEGLTTPEERIFCENGAIYIGKRKIDDHDPYGYLTVAEIMQNSSNVGTIKLGQRVGPARLKYYVERYGFGQKTSIDLPAEAPGQVPRGDWSQSTLASVSIGHEISVTPLQTATIVSTIANGGIRYKPYVVQKIDDPRLGITEVKPGGTRVMAEKTALEVRWMLEDVVTDGTAKTSRLTGYRAAGKTGTAQKFDSENGGYFSSKYVSSFAGFVPVSNPKFTIVVVIDDPKGRYYGGEVAAPVFKRIAEQVLRNKSIAPDDPDYQPKRYTESPERKQQQPSSPLSPKKPEVRVLDVTTRSGQSGSGFEFGEIVVPDFTGLSIRQVMDESSKLGLEHRISGFGQVISQKPLPGSVVRPGTRIQFTLSLNN
ncbi:MAG TPA: penicillin-binding protein, partial [Terriglobia bacterium]|nr:penicillin-binding protein [Terriglobia bacterium]